jgi:hypothetical protein
MAGTGRFEFEVEKRTAYATFTIVIARLDRATQYSRVLMMESKSRGVLDAPLEPVIGLAEGETRWRGMTTDILEAACPRISNCKNFDRKRHVQRPAF